MIKLTDLLEHKEEHPPYMYSKVGFSCAVCSYLKEEKGEYKCMSSEYKDYMGTNVLVDDNGKPLTKDLLKHYCSNWFEPKS